MKIEEREEKEGAERGGREEEEGSMKEEGGKISKE